MKHLINKAVAVGVGLTGVLAGYASSHREAPLITHSPKLDCTDYYSFRSYEPGRTNYVTMIANYIPLQDAYGGPNYFEMDPNAYYEIHVDNSGDAQEDITFRFKFGNALRNFALPVGPEGNRRTNSVPVLAVGQITAGNDAALLVDQTYELTVIRGPRRTGTATPILNSKNNSTKFTKPQDNVGYKTFPDYNAYADQYMYEIALPGTDRKGRVFVGQRKDPFVVNLGETFDLINISTSPLGPENANNDSLAYKNVTSIVIEVPTEFLLNAPNKPVIGSWATASKVEGNSVTQVSRLSMPLVNEVVIGVKDKDKFNSSEPKDDVANFVDYITHPTLPAIIELLYGAAGAKAPNSYPRNDLVAAFATGVDGLNLNGGVGEMQRLNTAIEPTPMMTQNNMGVIAGFSKGVLDAAKADLAGYPNGRRPGDDVVDISLRVVMGKLLKPDVAPAGDAPFTDGASVDARMFPNRFPYLNPPVAGSPNYTITIGTQTRQVLAGQGQRILPTYDSETQRLSAPKGDGRSGFLQIDADRIVNVSGASTDGTSISVKVN